MRGETPRCKKMTRLGLKIEIKEPWREGDATQSQGEMGVLKRAAPRKGRN